jgi:hypothetical protein
MSRHRFGDAEGPALAPVVEPAEKMAEDHFKLIMARRLKAIWADVLQEPLPPDLQALLKRLEAAEPRHLPEPPAGCASG